MDAYQIGGLCLVGVIFFIGTLVFALALCRAAAMGDEMIEKDMERRLKLATGDRRMLEILRDMEQKDLANGNDE